MSLCKLKWEVDINSCFLYTDIGRLYCMSIAGKTGPLRYVLMENVLITNEIAYIFRIWLKLLILLIISS